MQRRIYGEENELGLIPKNRKSAPPYELHQNGQHQLSQSLRFFLETISIYQRNGGMIYEDCGHVECAGPEASLVRDLVLASKGCEKLMEEIFSRYEEKLIVIKDNTDSATDEIVFGCHENYLYFDPGGNILDAYVRETVDQRLKNFRFRTNFLVNFILLRISLIVIAGAGVISVREEDKGKFYLSHRARFIKKLVDNSSLNQPLIDARGIDDAMTPSFNYQRLHISFSDPNMSEFSQYLKYGITGLVLRLAEDGLLPFTDTEVINPIKTLQAINSDLTCSKRLICLTDDRELRAVDVLRIFLKAARKHYPADDDPPDVANETLDIMDKAEETLNKLAKNPLSLDRELDHIILRKLMEKFLARKNLKLSQLHQFILDFPEEGDAILTKLKYLEQKYHELSPDGYYRLLCKKGKIRRILTDEEIELAKDEPPGFANPQARTRSWARGKLVQWAESANAQFSDHRFWEKLIIQDECAEEWCEDVDLRDPFVWDTPEIRRFLKIQRRP